MRINRWWIFGAAISLLPMLAVADTRDEERSHTIRWDITHIVSFTPFVTVDAGGMASAAANNKSVITVTGSGTFTVGDSDDVTGGGTWQTVEEGASMPSAQGRYRVTGLVRFDVAPGAQTSTTKDLIGDGTLADNRAGLAFLRVAYSDGSKGILVVSCDLPGNKPPGPAGAPDSLFEGITASKGFVDYWNRAAPVPGKDGNRTLFHVVSTKHED